MSTKMEERVTLDDGAQTILERWGNKGPVMLCVHGMTSSRKSWERFALHYSDRYRVYSYDQRGHGDSTGVDGPMTLHRSLLDLFNVLHAIDEPVDVLAGHSWGGAVAILGGRRFDVRRVVAVDPMVRQADDIWYDEFLSDLKTLFAKKGADRDAAIQKDYEEMGWAQLDIDRKKHAVRTMTTKPIERLRDDNPHESWDLRRDLENYPKPLYLAMADQAESIVHIDDLRTIREKGGPNISLRVFPGQGHNLHRTDFDNFIRELDIFLDRT